jgi:hypothetical protein
MRYYNLVLSNSSGQVYQQNLSGGFTLGNGGSTFTSYVNGQTIAGALNIEFDIPIYPFDTPQGGSLIRVWGIGLQMIGQSANLNGAKFVLSAGMKKGLPLATAASGQSGIIAQGSVYQAFGNWAGVNQTLDLICNPANINPPLGISFSWPLGGSLQTALTSALNQAFSPNYTVDVTGISPNLRPLSAQSGAYPSLASFSQYLKDYTQPIGAQYEGSSYAGVSLTIVGSTIFARDGTQPVPITNIAFQDMIGQPTWIGPNTVTFKTVLRSDIALGNQIKFPTGVIAPYALTNQAAAVPNAPARSKSIFQNVFVVNEVHHYANYRQPEAEAWNTTFTAIAS